MQPVSGISAEKKLQIFLEWEKLYTEAILDALKPSGVVLEIGFGTGYGSNRIQSFPIKTHTIIEPDPKKAQEASTWASDKKNVSLLHKEWQKALPSLGSFDVIFFHSYPIENEMEILKYLFQEEAGAAAKKAKELLNTMQTQMSQLTMHFSDKEIEEFYQKVGQNNVKEMPEFFKKLIENGNITQKQYEQLQKKYQLAENAPQGNQIPTSPTPDPMFLCLQECLKKHMHKDSRFSAILNKQVSKYDDTEFFENIITNPALDYSENLIPLKLSDKTRNALLMLIKKY